MNSLANSIGSAYSYLAECFLQQNYKDQEKSTWPIYQTITVFLLAVAVGRYASELIINCFQPTEDTSELFWKELEGNQTGTTIVKDLTSKQPKLFSRCDKMSRLFSEYLENGLQPEIVVDLGCGPGANSAQLLKKGVKVIAIDNMASLLDIYQSRIENNEKEFVTFQCADLATLEKYTQKEGVADVVLAIDVLPYLPISSWKDIMEKIVISLKPGGYFFGTLYVKSALFNSADIEYHERIGAQYYSIQDLAPRLIQHSGLEMMEYRLKEGRQDCYEFAARKPTSL